VEDYRHRILGLPYGTPATPAGAAPSVRALGPPPADPDLLTCYTTLLTAAAQLDLSL
jgi:hypothetical protein